ncbi:hypothetical protein BH10PLA2_BH10PLA2_04450 [soil metagenome]
MLDQRIVQMAPDLVRILVVAGPGFGDRDREHFATFITWAHFGNLFEYNENTEEISLMKM